MGNMKCTEADLRLLRQYDPAPLDPARTTATAHLLADYDALRELLRARRQGGNVRTKPITSCDRCPRCREWMVCT